MWRTTRTRGKERMGRADCSDTCWTILKSWKCDPRPVSWNKSSAHKFSDSMQIKSFALHTRYDFLPRHLSSSGSGSERFPPKNWFNPQLHPSAPLLIQGFNINGTRGHYWPAPNYWTLTEGMTLSFLGLHFNPSPRVVGLISRWTIKLNFLQHCFEITL